MSESYSQKVKALTLILGTLTMTVFLSVVVSAWTEPGSAPPSGNVPAPINVGSTAQTKTGALTVTTLTTSAGKLYLNTSGAEGDIERANAIIGYNDLFLKSNSAENAPVYISGSQLDFWSGGSAKWRIDSTGTLTVGSVPWARVSGFTGDTTPDTIADDGVISSAEVNFNYAGSSSKGGSATNALALSADGSNCAAGQYSQGIDASGNAQGCSAPAGGGDITGVYAGTGLSGGGSSGEVTLSLNLGSANTWTAAQTFSGGANFPGSGIWNTSGNVGIGTTGPGFKLDVQGGSIRTGGRLGTNNYNPDAGYPGGWGGGIHTWDIYSEGTIGSGTGGSLNAYFNKDGNAYFGGKVGIGTPGPGEKLEVAGNIKTNGGSFLMTAGQMLYSSGRMHIHGEELLYLLNKSGVIVSKAWGGNGNLTVEGNLCLGGVCKTSWPGGSLQCTTVTVYKESWPACATCPSGYTVTGGGIDDCAVRASYPSGDTTWCGECTYSGAGFGATIFARCCKL